MTSISIENLAAELQGPGPVVLLDVRREQARNGAGLDIPGTTWRNPAHWLDWKDEFAQAPRVLLYCAHGHEISQGLTAALRAMGVDAVSLDGGFSAWQSAGQPVCPLHSQPQASSPDTNTGRGAGTGTGTEKSAPQGTKWVTRERPKIDRIACPWLVSRFIDPLAEFLYVPASQVLAVAAQTGATPYDVPGVDLSHVGDLCSFDAFLSRYHLNDPALQQLATIVRGADTARLDLAPQSAGLYALSLGLSHTCHNDHDMLGHGLVMYDALYAWCQKGQGETHNWPPGA